MPILPAELLPFIVEFQPLFSKSVWKNAQTLLVGAFLTIGKRTVTACLRVMGQSDDQHFQNYHRGLNRAQWSTLAASRLLLRLLVATFAPTGEVVFGLDDTIERRRGEKINAKGIYRDPVPLSRIRISSKPVVCVGSVVCCWPRCRGPTRCGACPF